MSISSTVNGFLDLPARPSKPREIGITHVMDKGLSPSQIEGLMATGGEYVDIVKLGWGTSYVTQNLREKLALYRSLGIPVSAAARCSRSPRCVASSTATAAG